MIFDLMLVALVVLLMAPYSSMAPCGVGRMLLTWG